MRSVLYIGNKLSEHGNTPTAIEVLGPLLEREGIKVKYASAKKNMALRLLEMLSKTFSNRNVNFVLIDTYSTSNYWYVFAVSQLCRILKIKYIPILHGGGLPKRLTKNPRWSRMIFKNAFVNVAPSGYLLKKFIDSGFRDVLFIPNPVELEIFPFLNREFNIPKLMWVRSLSAIYNPFMLIRVASILKLEFPQMKILMVGPDKSNMLTALQKEAAELNLDIAFTGKLEKAEWAAKAIDYNIFVNTSHIDNAPYSLIEAASLGLPIVSTNVGGIPYIFENNKTALLVDDDDAPAMAKAISILISDRNLSDKLIANARNLSLEFRWESVKHKWLQILG